MKKFILLFNLFAIAFVCPDVGHSQTAMTNPNGLALDTATQAAAEGPTYASRGFADVVSFTIRITKISGTVAGSVALQGSNNISKGYATIGTADTLVDASQTLNFADVPKKYLYYKILITGTGTMSASYSATAYSSKR